MRRIALREFLEIHFEGSEKQLREFLEPTRPPEPEYEPEPRLDTALL
jgi:hypothetical protein